MKDLRISLLAIVVFALLIGATSCNQPGEKLAAMNAPAATITQSPTPTPGSTLQPVGSKHTLKVGNLERSYLLRLPPGLDNARPAPVVFVFHGWGGSATEVQAFGFNQFADQDGFLIVAPNGTDSRGHLSWNAGGCCGTSVEDRVDETEFIRQILADIETIVKVDPKRIYAVGFSNGAMLVYRLGCEMSDVFAAIASVSGPLFYSPCQPQQPVSLIHVHGLADTVVPFAGGGDIIPGGFPPVDQGVATWAQLNGCGDSAQVKKQKDGITHTIYPSCRAGSAVELYAIEGQSHGWSNDKLSTSEVIWNFFAAHPKP